MRSGLVAFLTLVGAMAAAAPTYHLTDLGTLGGADSYSTGVNAAGQVVGNSNPVEGLPHAFLYSGGVMHDLGTFGGSESMALAINASGQVVGAYTPPSGAPDHAFLYSGGVMKDLGTLGGLSSWANGINTLGQIVGDADTADGKYHAFLYSGGSMKGFGPVGWEESEATAINDSGQIVGDASLLGGPTSYDFLYSNGHVTVLGTLGGDPGAPETINASGQIVGYSFTAGDAAYRAFLYSGGVMIDLGTLGGKQSIALGINASGQVVGGADMPGNTARHAFLYSGGVMVDLNDLLDGSGSGYTVGAATGIADNGLIAAMGTTPSGGTHALLLTLDGTVAGTVSLQDFVGDVTQVPVVIEIRNPGTTNVVQTETVDLKADGTFSFATTLAGTYDVTAKASHWLRKKLSNVTFAAGGVSGLNFSLINGDVNGDNNINLADAAAISYAWRTKPGDAKYNPNADLNGDGSINLADAVIVSKNWRKTGDP